MKKFLLYGLIVLFMACIAGLFILPQQVIQLTALAQAKELSAQAGNVFLASDPSHPRVNEYALHQMSEPFTRQTGLATYHAKEGFDIISFSAKWDEAKLELLYEELLKNEHGKEIETLRSITIHAEEDEYASADHLSSNEKLYYMLHFPAVPSAFSIGFEQLIGTINLYDGDNHTTIQSMAHSLSHEYGHHYTYAYMFPDGEPEGTEYEALRNVPKDLARYRTYDDTQYEDLHMWYLIEIAAEDYVQLMGSLTTRNITDYKDIQQTVFNSYTPTNRRSVNGTPQENLFVPLANEIEGLDKYFHSFIGVEKDAAAAEINEITIKVQSDSVKYELSTGWRTFVFYRVIWNKAYGDDAIYTLLAVEENESYGYPVKTVRPGASASAIIGTYAAASDRYIHWSWDSLDSGTKYFVVTAVLPDGTVHRSEPLKYTFK